MPLIDLTGQRDDVLGCLECSQHAQCYPLTQCSFLRNILEEEYLLEVRDFYL